MFELPIDSAGYLRIRNLLRRRRADTHGTFPRHELEKIVLVARIKFCGWEEEGVEFAEMQSVPTGPPPRSSRKVLLLNVGRGYLMRL